MRIRAIRVGGVGVDLSFSDCVSLSVAFLVPKEDLIAQPWNWLGLTCFVGPVVLVGLELSEQRVSVCLLNAVLTFFWSC